MNLLLKRNEEEKRRKRLEEIGDVRPFRMGLKWGLKSGERIVVPPCYRNICPPVGGFVYSRRMLVNGD